jgi:hypothetical protein
MKSASDTTTDDRSCSLSTLRARTGKPLRDAVLEIYEQLGDSNDKLTSFQKNLRCFIPEETSDELYHHDGQRKRVRTLLRPCSQVKQYVALSYPWYASCGESGKRTRYRLPDKPVPVRDVVLDRTIRFIRYKQGPSGMLPFWIDKLSLEQKDTCKKEEEMQSMDLVYKRCTFAIGYLWVELKTQVQVDRLSSLLRCRIVKEPRVGQSPALEEGVDAQTVNEVLDLLVQITDDKWWSRAWIFQEDYLAWPKMWLLIRHAEGLDKKDAEKELGQLPGELVVNSGGFKKYLTLFCLALKDDRRSFVRSTCAKLLQKAGQYKVLNKYRSEDDIPRTITIDVLKDLNERDITNPADFLAITANICGYDNRILATKNKTLKMSLSLGILALCISNGELFRNDCEDMAPYVDIFEFLEKLAMPISPPSPDRALLFMKHCRFSVDRLSSVGIHTKGIIWKLSDPIRPDLLQPRTLSNHKAPSQSHVYLHGLNDYQRSRLVDLVRVLNKRNERRYKSLANDLDNYLRNHERSTKRDDDWPTSHAINVMAACIVDGMDTGKYLQIARIVGEQPEGGQSRPCRAIFVRDLEEMQRPGPRYVFTSWTPTKARLGDEVECKILAKYVSMEVIFDKRAQHGVPSLRGKRWINGLCFFAGEKKSPFVFAWPESLCG